MTDHPRKCFGRLFAVSLLATVLLLAWGVPVGAATPSISLSSQNIQTGQSTTATATFVNVTGDATVDPPVHASVETNANRGLGNPGHITLTVVSTSPNLTGCVVTNTLLQGEKLTCDWTGPPVAGDSAQIVVTLTASDDAVGGWIVSSSMQRKSGLPDSASATQFQVTKAPPPAAPTSPPIVAPPVEVVPNFTG